jgi:FdhD protein
MLCGEIDAPLRIIPGVQTDTPRETLQSQRVAIHRCERGALRSASDIVALEEPLEIRLDCAQPDGRMVRSLSITMRTPGSDEELAAGFLLAEGVVHDPCDIERIRPCGLDDGIHGARNAVRVRLADHVRVDWPTIERHVGITSSCGVCGKNSLDALERRGLRPAPRAGFRVGASTLSGLPDRLRAAQRVFEQTGGLHAAALFDSQGELLDIREDVGRHNAVDKLLGAQFLRGAMPLTDRLLFLSGRVSFELMQKALVAGLPAVVAVGAPSSLAVEMARRFDMTLIGFVRGDRFNAYHGEWRVEPDQP